MRKIKEYFRKIGKKKGKNNLFINDKIYMQDNNLNFKNQKTE